jgi:hypothetical protein
MEEKTEYVFKSNKTQAKSVIPLEEQLKMMKDIGVVYGDVELSLDFIFNSEKDKIMKEISRSLIGDESLKEIKFYAKNIDKVKNLIILEVQGEIDAEKIELEEEKNKFKSKLEKNIINYILNSLDLNLFSKENVKSFVIETYYDKPHILLFKTYPEDDYSPPFVYEVKDHIESILKSIDPKDFIFAIGSKKIIDTNLKFPPKYSKSVW